MATPKERGTIVKWLPTKELRFFVKVVKIDAIFDNLLLYFKTEKIQL